MTMFKAYRAIIVAVYLMAAWIDPRPGVSAALVAGAVLTWAYLAWLSKR